MTYDYLFGLKTLSKKPFHVKFKKITDDLSERHLILDQQGGGKTGVMMSLVYGQNKAFQESKGKYGAFCIVFVTKFEWLKVRLASLDNNIAPGLSPEQLDATHLTFPCCGKSRHIIMPEVSINFKDLTVEDIGAFANMKTVNELGSIKSLIETLPEGFDIDEFLEGMKNEDGKVYKEYRGLYYIFSTLHEQGLFDTETYPEFDWFEYLCKMKPIIFSFGKITNALYQALVGVLLRKLYELGDFKFNESLYKYNMLIKAKEQGKKLENVELTFLDKFLISYFNLALFIDEAPKLFPPTPSRNLKSYPATYHFKEISSNDGRKIGFKYAYLITQYYKDIYDSLRGRAGYLWFGNKVSSEDRQFLADHNILHRDDIPIILKNDKFCFSLVDHQRYKNLIQSKARARAISKFKVYRSPCGLF